MLGVLLEALQNKRPLNKRREEIERETILEQKKRSKEDSVPKATGGFNVCPLIRRQVSAEMLPCLVVWRGGLSLQSFHFIFTDGVCENFIVVASSCFGAEGRGHSLVRVQE